MAAADEDARQAALKSGGEERGVGVVGALRSRLAWYSFSTAAVNGWLLGLWEKLRV